MVERGVGWVDIVRVGAQFVWLGAWAGRSGRPVHVYVMGDLVGWA